MKQLRLLSMFLLLASLALGIVGCGKKDLATMAVGKWSGKMALPPEQANNPMAKMMEGMMVCSFDLKADKTFTGTITIMPAEGNWVIESEKVKLTMTKFMGMDMESLKKQAATNPAAKAADLNTMDKPLFGSLSEDGKTFTLDLPGSGGKEGTSVAMTKEVAK